MLNSSVVGGASWARGMLGWTDPTSGRGGMENTAAAEVLKASGNRASFEEPGVGAAPYCWSNLSLFR